MNLLASAICLLAVEAMPSLCTAKSIGGHDPDAGNLSLYPLIMKVLCVGTVEGRIDGHLSQVIPRRAWLKSKRLEFSA